MPKISWTEITKDDVIKAIEKFLTENPEYPEPRSTFLVYADKKLPAKHIRGMAYREHYGVEISKNDFGGGMETVRFFEKLGFEMEYHGTITIPFSEKTAVKKSSRTTEEKESSEVEQQSLSSKDLKIKIPTKQVIEQKNALQLLLNRMFDGDIVCEKTYPWLKTPEQISGPYKKVYESLAAYRGDSAFAKKAVVLRCDFVCEGKKLIIEYDERQHFSEARRISLEAYKNIPLLYDRDLWTQACRDINAKDNVPANRDEIRAYYDSTRDIACYENGYKLVRIMHGQIDFESDDAYEKLECLLQGVLAPLKPDPLQEHQTIVFDREKESVIKVAMYLQTDELKNKRSFDKILPIMKSSDADIIVFPENCYIPNIRKLTNTDIGLVHDQEVIFAECLALSKTLGKAVVVSSHDKYDTIYSVFANADSLEGETDINLYIKHTMCGSSCLDFQEYPKLAPDIFDPILYHGYLIGMTICYDCNHALFSRMYGLYGIDLIINSTGGNVVYDKWFKYNKTRAIENNCYTLVTMGGDGHVVNGHNYVFGFNKNGGTLKPTNLCGDSDKHNIPGGLYVYSISADPGEPEVDNSNQVETENKNWQLEYPVGRTEDFLKSAQRIAENIYFKSTGHNNVFLLVIDGEEILKPEKIQALLYSDVLKKYNNRKYIIICRYGNVDEKVFAEKLSVVLKVRAMENFCAVIFEARNINKCYQCGKNRTAQVVKATNDYWRIDLERTSGPEAIWKNKQGMRASWRKNYEWLVNNAEKLYE